MPKRTLRYSGSLGSFPALQVRPPGAVLVEEHPQRNQKLVARLQQGLLGAATRSRAANE